MLPAGISPRHLSYSWDQPGVKLPAGISPGHHRYAATHGISPELNCLQGSALGTIVTLLGSAQSFIRPAGISPGHFVVLLWDQPGFYLACGISPGHFVVLPRSAWN